MAINRSMLAAASESGPQTDLASNDARLVPLYMERGGVTTNFVGVALPDGRLFKFNATVSRGQANQLRELALRTQEGAAVVTDDLGIVYREGREGRRMRVGQLLDFRGNRLDVTNSVTDAFTGERRARQFLPISLILDDETTGSFKVSVYGQAMVNEILAASKRNVEDALRLVAYLPHAFRGEFVYDDEAGLQGLTPEGLAFETELSLALTHGVEDDLFAETDETEAETTDEVATAEADEYDN
jgi:hypothetical protein